MKCPVCKYLNVREEARKQLNEATLRNLRFATRELSTLNKMAEGVVKSNCETHMDSTILARHLNEIGKFGKELDLVANENLAGVPTYKLQALFNKYKDPRS